MPWDIFFLCVIFVHALYDMTIYSDWSYSQYCQYLSNPKNSVKISRPFVNNIFYHLSLLLSLLLCWNFTVQNVLCWKQYMTWMQVKLLFKINIWKNWPLVAAFTWKNTRKQKKVSVVCRQTFRIQFDLIFIVNTKVQGHGLCLCGNICLQTFCVFRTHLPCGLYLSWSTTQCH